MKFLVTIQATDSTIIFHGKPLDIPMKPKDVSSLCMELFSDPDPCIIHQSFAIKKLSDKFIGTFKPLPVINLSLMSYKDKLLYVDIENIEKLHLTIEVKK